MHVSATIALDTLTLAACGAAIFYCIRLSRQFERMRADRRSFELLIQSLNTAADRAADAIKAFKDMAEGEGDALQERINKSRAMANELEIVIAAGDSLADRLESLAEKSAKTAAEPQRNPAVEKTSAPEKAISAPEARPRTRAEKELLEAVKAKQQS